MAPYRRLLLAAAEGWLPLATWRAYQPSLALWAYGPLVLAQTVLCVPSKSQAVCPRLGIYEPSEFNLSGLGTLIKKSILYLGPKSWPWINSPLAWNHFDLAPVVIKENINSGPKPLLQLTGIRSCSYLKGNKYNFNFN